MSKCKVCGKAEEEAEFYSSIKTYCKEHWREQVKKNRADKADYYREFDRNRSNLPHRVEYRAKYRETDAYSMSHRKACTKWESTYPERKLAQTAISNAIRDGKITPMPCFVCGAHAQAHHPAYSEPLLVTWLCPKHHAETHKLGRELLRGERKSA